MRDEELREDGFTLIELLVVMAIIIVLASMLLPSLGRAKEQARMIQCLNNLRQLGISIKLYSDDHNSKFPPTTVYEPTTGAPKETRQTLGGFDPIPQLLGFYPSAQIRPLHNYMKPSEVYRCPVDKGQADWPCPPILKPTNWKTLGCSYQFNAGALLYPVGGGFRRVGGSLLLRHGSFLRGCGVVRKTAVGYEGRGGPGKIWTADESRPDQGVHNRAHVRPGRFPHPGDPEAHPLRYQCVQEILTAKKAT